MKYRLTHDDGITIDVPVALWESVLERAYRNGWRPSGTEAPWANERLARKATALKVATASDPPPVRGGRWSNSDYFSACSQYVRAPDAWELGTAAMRLRPPRADGIARPDDRHDAGVRKVADFARDGGFVIGRAPDHAPLQ
jgi:hypothetical protein